MADASLFARPGVTSDSWTTTGTFATLALQIRQEPKQIPLSKKSVQVSLSNNR